MRLNRTSALVFSIMWTVLAAVMSVGGVFSWWEDLRGGNATATVVHVYAQDAYTISFTTTDGTRCETPHKWNPQPEPVKAGDTFEVHYSRNLPCDNVRRTDEGIASSGLILMAVTCLIVGVIAIIRIRSTSRRGTT